MTVDITASQNLSKDEVDLLSHFTQAEEEKRQISLSCSRHEEVRAKRSERFRESLRHTLQFTNFRLVSLWAHRFVSSHNFEVCMSLLIISNAIFVGVEVEYSAQFKTADHPEAFWWIAVFYCVTFTIELALRVLAEGSGFVYKTNWRWNFFDSIIVAISLLELAMGDLAEKAAQQVPSIRIIRMARVVRVLRIARVMRQFRSLRVLVHSVFNTLRSLMWTLLLLGVILFVFAILFTQAATQNFLFGTRQIPELDRTYGTLGKSFMTLFQAISGGVSWRDITRPLGELHGAWEMFYLIYFAFTYFAVLNVVTGVFCQTAIESANRDHDLMAAAQLAAKQQYIRELKKLFHQVDVDSSGKVTLEEFEESMRDERLQAYFASLDISIDEAFSLFKLLDQDASHAIDIDNFVTGCLKLRGVAKSIDLAMMMYETRWNLQRCFSAIKALEDRCFIVCDNGEPATGGEQPSGRDLELQLGTSQDIVKMVSF